MEFDKSRVYTVLNADELKVGSRVIVADDFAHLKSFVKDEDNICTLEGIDSEISGFRFKANDGIFYALAYLVTEPEEKKLKWTDLKVGDTVRKDEYTAMVVMIDRDDEPHIYAGNTWLDDDDLTNWEKVEADD